MHQKVLYLLLLFTKHNCYHFVHAIWYNLWYNYIYMPGMSSVLFRTRCHDVQLIWRYNNEMILPNQRREKLAMPLKIYSETQTLRPKRRVCYTSNLFHLFIPCVSRGMYLINARQWMNEWMNESVRRSTNIVCKITWKVFHRLTSYFQGRSVTTISRSYQILVTLAFFSRSQRRQKEGIFPYALTWEWSFIVHSTKTTKQIFFKFASTKHHHKI